tara:strand:+ start:95 stop:340 length:246 start_codon:yes stop_codon:yes gene_type:complete
MTSVATGTKVLLFAFLEFSSFEDCNKAREILAPLVHHDLIYQCEWHNHSSVFFFEHSAKHKFYSTKPHKKPHIIDFPTNAR